MIPANEWWAVLINYNETILPFQWIWGGIGLIVILIFLFLDTRVAEKILKIYLAVSFLWISIGFFLILGNDLPMRVMQSLCFGCLAVLFGYDILRKPPIFVKPSQKSNKIIFGILLCAVLLYPVFGLLLGHKYPQTIIYGTFPCPTSALALVFLMWNMKNFHWQHWLSFLLLLIWAIPFPIFIQIPQFGAYEDGIMLSIGIIALVKVGIMVGQKRKQVGNAKGDSPVLT